MVVKKTRILLIGFGLVIFFSSCRVWNNMFPPKYGCPSNGKNIGAERVLDGDPETTKALKKAKKFKA
jgi:hypothetical protein